MMVHLKGSTINHTVTLSSGLNPQANEDIAPRLDIHGPRDHLPAAEDNVQVSVWVRFIPHCTVLMAEWQLRFRA